MSQTRAATIELQDLDIYAPESCVLHDNKTLAPQLPGEHQHEQHEQHDSSETQASGEESSLPLVDRGKDAWLFLAACWAVEAITFGFGFSFGIFQDYYSSHEPFSGSSSIAAIGTTTSGLLYIGTPFVLTICRLYPRWTRWFTLIGLTICSLSMALSSFCNTVPQLIGVQGVLFGFGGCIAYCPSTLYIDEWFDQRKGMAYGIVWSAAGAGGVVLPLVLQALLDNLGFRTTMRIWSGIIFACAIPLTWFVKPRLPALANRHKTPFRMRFAVSKRFLLYQMANVIEATGYFLPGIYLPTFARETAGTSNFMSALTLLLINVTCTIGLVAMGSLSDRLQVTTCMVLSATGAAISVLVIWGLSASLPVLYVFCVFYGLFAGSWSATWPGIMREVARNGEADGYGLTDPVMVQGHLCVGRGLGNVVSGPLSAALLRGGKPWKGQARGSYGTGYGVLILYTGATALVGVVPFLGKLVGLV